MNQPLFRFNKAIDAILAQADWAIDEHWGLTQLAKYISEVEMVSSGILEFKELGFSDRRKELVGKVIKQSVSGFEQFSLNDPNVPAGSFAHLRLDGVMRMDDGLSSRGVRNLCNEIGICNSNPNISGIILEVNSGGGESLAGHYLHSTMKDVKKPVVVWAHFAGSAAVNGIVPADHIMLASEGAEIGSIGTMVSLDMGYIEWYKENYKDIYSSKSPDKNLWFREILKGNEKPLIQEIDKNADAFHANVNAFRKLPDDTKESTLRGGMFIAQEGVSRGLADSIGTLNDAISRLMQLVNGNNISQQNFGTMNFQSAYHSLVLMLNSFFGWSLEKDSTEIEVKAQFDNVGASFKEAVTTAIADASASTNETLTGLMTQLESAATTIKNLEGKLATIEAETASLKTELQGKIDTLSAQVTTLTESNTTLISEKADLEKRVAELTGTAGDNDSNSDDAINGTAAAFMDNVGKIQISGDSKY